MQRSDYHIFLGTQDIAGMMARLTKAFTEIGIDNHFFEMKEYYFRDQERKDELWCMKSFMYHTDKIRNATNDLSKKLWTFLQMIDCILIFIYALLHYNEFIYIFGDGIFPRNVYLKKIRNLEYRIEKLLGKKMVMWYCGSDSRAPYCDVDVYHNLERATKAKAGRIRTVEKYMTVIDSPASSHFHTKKYIKYNCIGVPIDKNEIVEAKQKKEGIITIAHCPSNTDVKGTDVIRKTVQALQEKYRIKYVEVTNLPHKAVLEALSKADIVVDQMYSDTPMAGLASEASANGIPVIVCGYYAEKFKEVFPAYYCPNVYCMPDALLENLEKLIIDSSYRDTIGRREREFIWHESLSQTVAAKFIKILDGDIPKEWLYDPQENDYIYGCGIHKDKIIRNVIKMINEGGINSLCLEKASLLENNYLALYEKHKQQ